MQIVFPQRSNLDAGAPTVYCRRRGGRTRLRSLSGTGHPPHTVRPRIPASRLAPASSVLGGTWIIHVRSWVHHPHAPRPPPRLRISVSSERHLPSLPHMLKHTHSEERTPQQGHSLHRQCRVRPIRTAVRAGQAHSPLSTSLFISSQIAHLSARALLESCGLPSQVARRRRAVQLLPAPPSSSPFPHPRPARPMSMFVRKSRPS